MAKNIVIGKILLVANIMQSNPDKLYTISGLSLETGINKENISKYLSLLIRLGVVDNIIGLRNIKKYKWIQKI